MRKLSPSRVASRYAAQVIQFPGSRVRNTHTVAIHGEKYVLSTDSGPLAGDLLDRGDPSEGGARVIQGPGDPWKFLWVYDTERQIVALWRVTDGDEKFWTSATSLTALLVKLDKKNQLNRVDHATYLKIEQDMSRRARENERALTEWIEEMKSDFQRVVDVSVQDYFDSRVRPELDRQVREIDSGVVPIGFKSMGSSFPMVRQMKSHVISQVFSRLFSLDKIDKWVEAQGIDLSAGDGQATFWAQGDIQQAYAEQVLR